MSIAISSLSTGTASGCLSNKKRLAFLTHLTECFKELDLSISLEGIQDETIFKAVSDINADHLQGYYFGEPIEIDVFAQTAGETMRLIRTGKKKGGEPL